MALNRYGRVSCARLGMVLSSSRHIRSPHCLAEAARQAQVMGHRPHAGRRGLVWEDKPICDQPTPGRSGQPLRRRAFARSGHPGPPRSAEASPICRPVVRTQGVQVGRVAIRASGSVRVGIADGIAARHCVVLQRADGYASVCKPGCAARAAHPIPPQPKGRGLSPGEIR
jgi:hypothetical protein